MLPRRIAGRYAEALFDLAQQEGTTEAWEQELAGLAQVITDTPELWALLTHPEISLRRKREVVERAFQGKMAESVLAVLLLLLRRGHEPDMRLIHAIFVEKWNAARRIIPALVTSAVPLTDTQAQSLIAALARRTGGDIRLRRQVDPNLIAGLVVTVGDRVIDASAHSTLEGLREAMRG